MAAKGAKLEGSLKKVNMKLRLKGEAVILKKEIPIVVTKDGLHAQQSTVDFEGVGPAGKHVAYDAKECKSKTSFPLANIKIHQLEYLLAVKKLTGYVGFIVHFISLYETKVHVVPVEVISKYMLDPESRKSIPISEFKDEWLVEMDNYLSKIIEINTNEH